MNHSVFRRVKAFLASCFSWDKAFARRVVVITLPIILQELIASSLHIVDGLMVSGLGDTSYAAVTQAGRYSFLYILFCFGVTSGGAIFMSQFWGARDIRRMRQSMGVSFVWIGVVALVFITGATVFTDFISRLFLPQGESASLANLYLRWVAPSYLFQGVNMVYAACLKSSEKTHIPLISSTAGIALNTLLNYLLIYGHFGFPAMGVKGAAIATSVAAMVTLGLTVSISYGLHLPAAAKLKDMLGIDSALRKRFAKTTVPVVFNEGLWALGVTMYGIFYGRIGDTAVAAMGIVSTVDNLLWVFIFGMMHATAIICGKAIGASKPELAYLYAKRMLSLFTGLSAPVIQTAAIVLGIESFTMWFRAFNAVNVVGVLRSGGDTVFSLKLDVGAMWLIGVPLCAAAVFLLKLPVEYVYICTLGEEIVKVLIGIPHFRSRVWIKNLTEGDIAFETN
ncbi:MAG TPA: MATE family efflux transporter [Candidatus Limiplasma sp.]|nr:MATE family efflux transporter [Candidatus Limiplasma sp.]